MKGTYLLILKNLKPLKLKIGKLREIYFNKKFYIYVGSALNNLEKRIKRHLLKNKKLHWHIDYLTTNENFKIIRVYYKTSARKEECFFANKLSNYFKSIKGFGSTDCKCKSHLFETDLQEFNFIKDMGFKIFDK